MSLRLVSAVVLGLVVFCSGMASASAIEIRTLDGDNKENGLWTLECGYDVTVESTTLKEFQYRPITIAKVDPTKPEVQIDTLLAGVCPRTLDIQASRTSLRGSTFTGSVSVPSIVYLTDFSSSPTYQVQGEYVTTCNYDSAHGSGSKSFFPSAVNTDKKSCTVRKKATGASGT